MSITTKEEMIERLKHFASNNDALRNLIKTLQRAEKIYSHTIRRKSNANHD